MVLKCFEINDQQCFSSIDPTVKPLKCTNIFILFFLFLIISQKLGAIAYKYRESHGRKENWDFLLLRQKDPFGELFSEIYFQSSSEFTFL